MPAVLLLIQQPAEVVAKKTDGDDFSVGTTEMVEKNNVGTKVVLPLSSHCESSQNSSSEEEEDDDDSDDYMATWNTCATWLKSAAKKKPVQKKKPAPKKKLAPTMCCAKDLYQIQGDQATKDGEGDTG